MHPGIYLFHSLPAQAWADSLRWHFTNTLQSDFPSVQHIPLRYLRSCFLKCSISLPSTTFKICQGQAWTPTPANWNASTDPNRIWIDPRASCCTSLRTEQRWQHLLFLVLLLCLDCRLSRAGSLNLQCPALGDSRLFWALCHPADNGSDRGNWNVQLRVIAAAYNHPFYVLLQYLL